MKINNNEIDDSEPGVRVVKQIDGDIRNGIAIVCADFIYRYMCSQRILYTQQDCRRHCLFYHFRLIGLYINLIYKNWRLL